MGALKQTHTSCYGIQRESWILKELASWIKSEKGIPDRGNNIDKDMTTWHSIMDLGPAVVRSLSLICKNCGGFASFYKTPACVQHLQSGYTISDVSNFSYLLTSWTVLLIHWKLWQLALSLAFLSNLCFQSGLFLYSNSYAIYLFITKNSISL